MPVSSQHPEYKKASDRWELVQSIIHNDANHLIRTVDVKDPIRSEQYRCDAILTNFTRLTQEGLTGLVFRKPPKSNLSVQLDYLYQDATGMQFGLDQLAQKVTEEVLATGRYGLLAEMPVVNEDEPSNERLARIRAYNACSIINWDYIDVGNEYKLSLVVLRENISILGQDEFEWIPSWQWRVLKLVDGVYIQRVYNEQEEMVSSTIPTDYHGQPLNHIPFIFIGSENNDAAIDPIPLYDLAVINLGHYKADADLQEARFVCGQPVPHIDLSENTSREDFDAANPNGIAIGSRSGVVTFGGNFKFEQVQPNLLPQQVKKELEAEAAGIGARIIAPPGGRETAEGAKIRYGSQNSRLYIITKNIGLGFSQLLYYMSQYMEPTPSYYDYELNDQYYEETQDPNLLVAMIQGLDRAIVDVEEIRDNMRRSGLKLKDTNPTTEQQAQAIGQIMEIDNESPQRFS